MRLQIRSIVEYRFDFTTDTESPDRLKYLVEGPVFLGDREAGRLTAEFASLEDAKEFVLSMEGK